MTSLVLNAQDESQNNGFIANIIEDFLESTDSENFDYNTILESLNYFYEHPLDVNRANEQNLRDLFLLNEIQIANFMTYKAQFGNFLSIYELQAVPSWDLGIIRNVLPFLKCDIAAVDYNLDFKDALRNGTSTMFIKGKRVLEDRKGFLPDANGNTPYLGGPNHLYVRYRYEFGQQFKAGFTMEKDPGEAMFTSGNKTGFDFYSFFAYAANINKTLAIVSIGDYAASLGQGLIIHNAFGTSKSSFVLNVKKSGKTIRPYSSVNEVNFFRGGGTVLNLGKNWEAAVFGSYKPVDASVQTVDTTDFNGFDSFGSIRLDGFHRTEKELANKNSIHQSNAGGRIHYKQRDFKISANVLYTSFDKPLQRALSTYQQYLFNGKTLVNTSVDYSWRLRNLTFFGEVAASDNGGTAQMHGLLLGLDRKIDMSLVYRDYSPDYQVLNANAFGESTQPVNERGYYLGMELRPFKNVVVSTYADLWNHPWVGYRRDGLTDGKEFLLKMAYTIKRKMDFYIQYRYERKYLNSSNESIIDYPEPITLQRLRLHYNFKISKEWEIRDRAEYSFFKKNNATSRGFLMYQDVIYKPIAKPYSFNARYCIFDINSYDARIYTYENEILYEFYIPFFANRGTRFYVNSRYRIGRNYTFEFRIGRTYLQNADGFGSGNDYISGNTRTEIKTQLKIRF